MDDDVLMHTSYAPHTQSDICVLMRDSKVDDRQISLI